MILLGDIAISFDTCKREAADNNVDFIDHIIHLLDAWLFAFIKL